MEKERIVEISKDVINKSNKDLFDSLNELQIEYDKTKDLIINLTRHLENIELLYDKINNEIGKRVKK
jgi:hypothetical protein